MGLLELFFLAAGLSMDAFAVSVCRGLAMEKFSIRKAAAVGAWFGSFQAMMPLIGWFLGSAFSRYIMSFDHWIAFGLLALIGGNMIKESFARDSMRCSSGVSEIRTMFFLAVATSIDALAVGVTLAFLKVDILPAVCFIGTVTFIISAAGVAAGHAFGTNYKSKAEFAGGAILIILGVKILLEHLGIISF